MIINIKIKTNKPIVEKINPLKSFLWKKNIKDKKLITKIIYAVGACSDKKENPSKKGIKNQKNLLFVLIVIKNKYKDKIQKINVWWSLNGVPSVG